MLVQYHESGSYDCTSCQGKLKHCLLYEDSVDLKAGNMPSLKGVTRDNALAKLQSETFIRDCYLYGLCPLPVFPDDLQHLYSVYNMLDGMSRIQTPDELYDLPARYVHACQIINAERNRIMKQKRENK